MRFTPFKFFLEFEVEGVAFLSLFFLSPSGYLVFVKIDYSFKLPFDLCFGQPWGRESGVAPSNFVLYPHLTLLASFESSLPINLMLGSQWFDFHTSLPDWGKNQLDRKFG
jgi:hypothetical protein